MTSNICAHSLYKQFRLFSPSLKRYDASRTYSSPSALPHQACQPSTFQDEVEAQIAEEDVETAEEQRAMSRRLAEMTDEVIAQGGRSAQKAVEESGFSETLKAQLEQRILDSKFKSDNPAAFSQINMPVR